MPNSATEKLLKILKLESQTGCQDKAVTRGLASFTKAWLADAAKANIEPAWAESVAEDMRAYSAMTDVQLRRAALNALIQRLQAPQLAALPRTSTDISSFQQSRAAANFGEASGPAHAPLVTAPNLRQPAPLPPVVVRPTPLSQAQDEEAAQSTQEEPPSPAREESQVAPPVSQPRTPPASTQRTAAAAATRKYSQLGLDAPLTHIAGIGSFNADKFAKLGVKTIRDLLYFFPTRYDDYSALKTIDRLEYGEQVTIVGRVAGTRKQATKTGLHILRVTVEDASGAIECVWFTSQRYIDAMARQFQVGREIVISGKVTEYLGKLIFQNPSHEPAEREWITGGNIVPVYRLTEGLAPLLVRRVMKRVIEYWPQRVPESLPESVRQEVGLMPIGEALREIHWPRDMRTREAARRRLAFDELFELQLAVLRQRYLWRSEPAQPLAIDEETITRLITALPYSLTRAQQRAVRAIVNDLRQPVAMHRLLQGDVGSGKTVVAALAMAMTAQAGAQSALMAPTEILAEQHFNNLKKLFGEMYEKGALPPLEVRLLTGSLRASEKRAIYAELESGTAHLVIGTHALIQEGVAFHNLGFVVVDEQHRFGVAQRRALRQKGRTTNPHTLVMTATPIPRTLALTLYGDLDNTVLDEMPPGRQPVETHWVAPAERERAYSFVRSQIREGRQAFIICPLVEESDKIEAKAAVEEHARLQTEIFPQFKLGLLHGRMKATEKEEVMAAFARGDLHILVSTAVVEVGIDVPNATVMMIEGAERFGLAQLHQFRGRVGRGQHKSYCLLIADSNAALGDERLQAIVSTQDGFKLAEKDLEIRGPGEFFGTRQSGDPELKLVNMNDRDLLFVAREQAEKLLAGDPELTAPEHAVLAERVAAFQAARQAQGETDAS
ncbi:MAG: ATP-dependent DNA helicase RecG [Anaerolineae bacterium]|nr:ATP-dependent DNA helicase RecG [Thermoflexales bacterium]MDW8408003.1 ATP-dependent DNA helicase RecG [Anaerolineae bacterium]